ncbi:hypothetical protein Tco_0586038 [Tanacetum coccineum]
MKCCEMMYGMGDLTGVSVSLGGEIFPGGKKCQKSNIGDSDNTGDGGKIVGGAIGACGGIGERASEAKRSLVKSSEKLGEVFPGEAGKLGGQVGDKVVMEMLVRCWSDGDVVVRSCQDQSCKRETNIHQVGGSSEGVNLESEVPDEPKGKSIDTNEGTGLKPGVPNVSKADSSESKYESWGDSDDDDDQQSDDESTESNDDKNDEEYECINKEMYDDVNVELKDAEPAKEENGDEEMTRAENVNVEHEEVSQELQTEVPLQSSFIAFDYATKFLNFDNIPSGETKIISMMDIKVQHEDPISDLEKEVKELKNVDHSSALRATIKSEVLVVVKEYLGTSINDALYKVLQKHIADLSKEHFILTDVVEKLKQQDKPQKSVEDIRKKRALFETMTASKIFNKHPKYKDLYHALMESILVDEDAMDKGVADIQKKRKPDDADRDEEPSAGPGQGLKRRKTCKDTEQSKKAKSIGTSKGTTKSQLKSTASLYKQRRYCLRLETLKCHRILEKTWVTLMNQLLSRLTQRIGSRNQKGLLLQIMSGMKIKAAKYDLPGIEDMVPNLWSPIKVAYDKHALLGNGYSEKDKNKSKNGQNRARE